jgi:hypothetical protein
MLPDRGNSKRFVVRLIAEDYSLVTGRQRGRLSHKFAKFDGEIPENCLTASLL